MKAKNLIPWRHFTPQWIWSIVSLLFISISYSCTGSTLNMTSSSIPLWLLSTWQSSHFFSLDAMSPYRASIFHKIKANIREYVQIEDNSILKYVSLLARHIEKTTIECRKNRAERLFNAFFPLSTLRFFALERNWFTWNENESFVPRMIMVYSVRNSIDVCSNSTIVIREIENSFQCKWR